MKDVCIAYADKSGNGFSVSEPWIEDNFNTLEDCEQKANEIHFVKEYIYETY